MDYSITSFFLTIKESVSMHRMFDKHFECQYVMITSVSCKSVRFEYLFQSLW